MNRRLCGIDGRFRNPIRYGDSDSQSRRRKNERKAVHDPVPHHGYQSPCRAVLCYRDGQGLFFRTMAERRAILQGKSCLLADSEWFSHEARRRADTGY
jgi:hypothetical protein